MFNFNTDMADERRDILRNINNLNEISGVEVESIQKEKNIKINKVKITSEDGEKYIGKPIGTYITIDIKNLKIADKDEIENASKIVTTELKNMIDQHIDEKGEILVVGLGNIYVTPDSLRSQGCI